MPFGIPKGEMCVQRSDDSLEICNSHYVSHFAAFFIDARTKRSVVESFDLLYKLLREANDDEEYRSSDGLPPTGGRRGPGRATRRSNGEVGSQWLGVLQLCNDPSAGSPTETLLRLLLPLNDRVWIAFRPWVVVADLPGPVRKPH